MVKKQRWSKKRKYERDWKIYNEELILRGEFLYDLDFLKNWDKDLKEINEGKVGSPYTYPDSLIMFLSPMYNFLDLRKMEGALRRLSRWIPKLKVSNYTTISRRLNRLDYDINLSRNKKYDVITDSTGNKLSNRGEYIRHKWKVKRGWIKVSIAIDKNTKELLDVGLSLEDVSDPEHAKKHLDNLNEIEISSFSGDGAYYEDELYKILHKRNVKPIIKMRRDASNKGLDPMHKAVREMNDLGGYEAWRDKYEYGKRWHVEGYISANKRCFGECVRTHKISNCLLEAKRRFIDFERMKTYAKVKVKS